MEQIRAIDARSPSALLDLLEHSGGQTDDLRALMRLEEGSRSVWLDLYMEALKIARIRASDPGLHLQLASAYRPGRYGVLGFACITQSDLRQGLRVFARCIGLWITGVGVVISEEDGGLVMTIEHDPMTRPAGSLGRALLTEVVVGSAIAGARAMCAEPWVPERVELEHAPSSPESWALRLGVSPRRGRYSRVFLDAAAAALPLRNAHPGMAAFFERYALRRLQERRRDGAFSAAVRATIHALLPEHETTLKRVAAQLGMSPRTLQRRLAESGSRFDDLLDAVRLELAMFALQSGTKVITAALLCGYTEERSFRRAFNRWTGTSPSRWRAAECALPADLASHWSTLHSG